MHVTPLLVVRTGLLAAYSSTLSAEGRCNRKKKKRPALVHSHSAYHNTDSDNATGRRKPQSRRVSAVCAVRVYCTYPEQRLLVPRCAYQLKVNRTLVLEYFTV
jgi:hypothetical protein